MKKDTPAYEPCSQNFEEAFRDGFGGCRRTCACGRECFDGANSYDWSPGELEGLRENARLHPDKYLELPYCCSDLTVNNKTFVMGCYCNGARPYEDWIRGHAEKLAAFLVSVRQERLDHAHALQVADALENFPKEPARLDDPGYPVQNFS